jgi:hypothetical protein
MATGQASPNDERELFVGILSKLLRPLSDEVVIQVTDWERNSNNGNVGTLPDQDGELPIDEFIAEVHRRILARLYDLAQEDKMLSMAFIPLMAHLRKMPRP